MQKLRVGVIGAGMAFERLHYPAFQKLTDQYELSAFCDTDRFKAEDWANRTGLGPERAYSDWGEMLRRQPELDVIDILVPIELNYEVTEAVARTLAGQRKGIICEKPLAPTLDQAEAARDLARKHRIPILIAENYRYNYEIDLLRDLVRTRKVGDPVYFVQNRVLDAPGDMVKNTFVAKEWRQHPEYPGGVITDTALHDLAALRHIFGAIDKLQAFGRPQEAGYAPFSVIQANLLFKSGVTGQFTFFCAGKEMQRPLVGLRIFCTEGMLFLEERMCGTINVAFSDGRSEQIPYQPQAGYYNELLNFYNAMVGLEPISVPPELEYGDLKTVLLMLKSAEEGRIVQVDETADYRPVYGAPEPEPVRR